jgi:hypothetical protein
VVFLGPLSGKCKGAAKGLGLKKAADLVALRVDGPNKPGEAGRLTRLLADAGISLRGISAVTFGNKAAAFLAFDNSGDAGKAMRILRAAGRKR